MNAFVSLPPAPDTPHACDDVDGNFPKYWLSFDTHASVGCHSVCIVDLETDVMLHLLLTALPFIL